MKSVSSLENIDFRLYSPPTGLFEDFVALNKSLRTVHIFLNHAVDEGEEAVADNVIEIAKCFLRAPLLTKLYIIHSYFWTTVSDIIAVMLKKECRFTFLEIGNGKKRLKYFPSPNIAQAKRSPEVSVSYPNGTGPVNGPKGKPLGSAH